MKTKLDFRPMKQIEGETSQQWVCRALRFAIASGQIQPGDALTIRGIGALLNVSATPVREALKQLTSEGSLELKPNRRIMVPELTASIASELIELRIHLEIHAAERAFPYINKEHIERLKQINEKQNKAFEKQDLSTIILGNQDFHREIYMAHPDPVSMPLIERVWQQIGPLQRLAMSTLEDSYNVDHHIEIIHALGGRNLYGLRVAIEADIRDASGYMMQMKQFEQYTKAQSKNLKIPSKDYIQKLSKNS